MELSCDQPIMSDTCAQEPGDKAAPKANLYDAKRWSTGDGTGVGHVESTLSVRSKKEEGQGPVTKPTPQVQKHHCVMQRGGKDVCTCS